jgi:hypothetical protein
MKVRTLVARHPGGAITPKNDWRLYAENTMAPLRLDGDNQQVRRSDNHLVR